MFRRHSAPKRRGQGLSPALAPASGSTLRRVPRWCARPKPSLPSHTPPSTGSSAVGHLNQFLERLRFFWSEDLLKCLLGTGRVIRPVTKSLHTSVNVALVSGRSPSHEFLRMCADRSRHVIPDRNIAFLQVVRPSSSKVSLRSDKLKLLLAGRFGKLIRAVLSTFSQFRCGGEWISHRFGAKVRGAIICRAWPAGAAAGR